MYVHLPKSYMRYPTESLNIPVVLRPLPIFALWDSSSFKTTTDLRTLATGLLHVWKLTKEKWMN